MAPVKQLILASGSPFRKAILEAAGLKFQVRTAPVDEAAIQHPSPRELARLRGEAKALAVAALYDEALIVGADQVLSLDGEAFDKAKDAAEAEARLSRMAGRTHYLHSGWVIACGRMVLRSGVVEVPMPMRTLTASEIKAYVATGEWRGSVGCYQFEHRGIHLFDGVDSDQTAIIGLPMQPLLKALRELKALTLEQSFASEG